MRYIACSAALLLAGSAVLARPYVAYVGNVSVHSESPGAKIMVVDLATGKAVNVSEGLYSARSPAWSADGSKVTFHAAAEGVTDIFVCAPDGSGRVNLTQTPNAWETDPCFVGSDRVAFLSGPDRSDVWIGDLAGGAAAQLTSVPMFRKSLLASPDGSLIAVAASDKLAGPGDIYLIPAAGGEPRNLTSAPAIYSTPAFSPDGQNIAFCFDGTPIGGATRGVATMPLSGGEGKLLASDGYPLAPLCFSSDGSKLAYTSSSTYHSTWVKLIDLQSGEATDIKPSNAHIIGWPSFTPDGKSLAYQGVYAANYTARIVNLTTGENSQVTVEGETGVNPVCSPR